MRIPSHAAVAETVEGTKTLRGPSLSGLINAVLRSYLRDQEALDSKSVSHNAGKYGHPSWLLKLLQESYPEQWGKLWLKASRISTNVVARKP